MQTKIVINNETAGKRLDLVIPLIDANISRSHGRKLIDAGKITLNGEVEFRPQLKLKEGDELGYENDLDFEPAEGQWVWKGPAIEVPIIYADADLLIANKPADMPVHPTAERHGDDLLTYLYAHNAQPDADFYKLVNRLDAVTSGIVLVAKSPLGVWHYSKLFAQSQVEKEYIAIVSDKWITKFNREEIVHTSSLYYQHSLRKTLSGKEGQISTTVFKLLRKTNDGLAVLEVGAPPGAPTHQIRAHLAELGFPILGDTKYGGLPADRVMLHAHRINLAKPDGTILQITCAPDTNFA